MDLAEFNATDAAALTAELRACCDVPAWAEAVAARRPYADRGALFDVAGRAAAELTPEQVEQALAAHPRIGERAEGGSTDARWSRQEQSGVSEQGGVQEALLEGNRAYEERFGRVFLICATGLSGGQILAELRRRLQQDDARESAEVAGELRKIALLRLGKLLDAEVPA